MIVYVFQREGQNKLIVFLVLIANQPFSSLASNKPFQILNATQIAARIVLKADETILLCDI